MRTRHTPEAIAARMADAERTVAREFRAQLDKLVDGHLPNAAARANPAERERVLTRLFGDQGLGRTINSTLKGYKSS